MLESVDLKMACGKAEFKKVMPALEIGLGRLQRSCREEAIPVVIVFEGWDAAGKGTLINRLMLALDPRGYTVHPISAPTTEEYLRPPQWRFWTRIPARGRMAIFDRSWYGRVLVERVNKITKEKEWRTAFEEINAFERQLADDGAVIIKFFLHISKKEQKRRFDKLLSDKATAWKVTSHDWRNHERYKKYAAAIEKMLAKTHTPHAPWTVIEATDLRHATVKVFGAVTEALRNALEASPPRGDAESGRVVRRSRASILDKIDLSETVDVNEYERLLPIYQARIRELEHEIFLRRISVCIAYEGWDAAGKGGNIRRMVQGMDPRGFEVIPFAAPNEVERHYHYLWRFWRSMPKAGHIAISDRTWYGRVLVERVEGFCTDDAWQRAYAEINEMEKSLTDFGMVLVKFWLHIDQQEQLRRFKAREATDYKRWKITEEDWRNRKKWGLYKEAVDDMLRFTSTTHAPWTVVESNSKHYARLKSLKTVIDAIEQKL